MKTNKKKRGQVTIFIILGIIIVVLGILIFMFYPAIKSWFGDTKNPNEFIQICVEEEIKNSVEDLSLRGGSIDPEHYILYQGERIEYLCYTGEYYKTCIMQQPMLKKHIESEIKEKIEDVVKECFDEMETNYRKRGYDVILKRNGYEIELSPEKINANFDYSLTLKKEDSEEFDSFKVVLNNNLYELVSIANSILNWEARYGDSETTVYMNYYQNIKVEKKKQTDGSTIYILTERDTDNKFQFASRSVAWPPGYGSTKIKTNQMEY
jgi:hypothetical protein